MHKDNPQPESNSLSRAISENSRMESHPTDIAEEPSSTRVWEIRDMSSGRIAIPTIQSRRFASPLKDAWQCRYTARLLVSRAFSSAHRLPPAISPLSCLTGLDCRTCCPSSLLQIPEEAWHYVEHPNRSLIPRLLPRRRRHWTRSRPTSPAVGRFVHTSLLPATGRIPISMPHAAAPCTTPGCYARLRTSSPRLALRGLDIDRT
jgi:hypothetical protein